MELNECSQLQKQPFRGVLRKLYYENGAVSEIALQHERSLVNLMRIFRTRFPRNTSQWLLLHKHHRKVINLCFDAQVLPKTQDFRSSAATQWFTWSHSHTGFLIPPTQPVAPIPHISTKSTPGSVHCTMKVRQNVKTVESFWRYGVGFLVFCYELQAISNSPMKKVTYWVIHFIFLVTRNQ